MHAFSMHHEETLLEFLASRNNITQLSAPTTFPNDALGDPSDIETRNAQKLTPKKSRTHDPPIHEPNHLQL